MCSPHTTDCAAHATRPPESVVYRTGCPEKRTIESSTGLGRHPKSPSIGGSHQQDQSNDAQRSYFWWFLPHGQISPHHAHNLLILPAQVADDGDMDGIPVVCMEALANRRPVLSTTLSGIPELVNNEVGWLLDHSTVDGIQKILRALTSHLADLRDKGEQGPKTLIAGGFTYDQQSEALIKWFNNVTVSCQLNGDIGLNDYYR